MLKFGYCLGWLCTLKLAILFLVFHLYLHTMSWHFPYKFSIYLLYHMFHWAACEFCCYCSEEPTEPFTYLDLDPPKRETVKLEQCLFCKRLQNSVGMVILWFQPFFPCCGQVMQRLYMQLIVFVAYFTLQIRHPLYLFHT